VEARSGSGATNRSICEPSASASRGRRCHKKNSTPPANANPAISHGRNEIPRSGAIVELIGAGLTAVGASTCDGVGMTVALGGSAEGCAATGA